jgi:hypothetical protein
MHFEIVDSHGRAKIFRTIDVVRMKRSIVQCLFFKKKTTANQRMLTNKNNNYTNAKDDIAPPEHIEKLLTK